jgi:hypothetical protein
MLTNIVDENSAITKPLVEKIIRYNPGRCAAPRIYRGGADGAEKSSKPQVRFKHLPNCGGA